ncbi:NAD-dependent epimerase/dehydratase family protein [Marinobacter salsuginis]|uniref:NAD-dependent epimerase/dehydratase family protein n=1 Tax=Marinobacter salsuginis TaxID=418719 RepID=UPI00273E25A5|nr:NAD(P)-dependent oxidoreductase [Marinobacter salsuginis]
MTKILVTGHRGLIGRYLVPCLEKSGYQVVGLDIADDTGDITKPEDIRSVTSNVTGVVHLAAVSRVIWGERNPSLCWQTNAMASHSILEAASQCKQKPWVLLASSREVYGEPDQLPVSEDAPVCPVNIYGRAKARMEQYASKARLNGLNTAVVRLANVYGCVEDHEDRVLPAFCRNAAEGRPLRVDGFDHVFDFTHVDDTVRGIAQLVALLNANEHNLPPIHLLPGIGTTLLEAAKIAVDAADSDSSIVAAPSRDYDVARFIGNPERAKRLLGWEARITPSEGIRTLVKAFQTNASLIETA